MPAAVAAVSQQGGRALWTLTNSVEVFSLASDAFAG
jgi:hypothetical protein